MSIESALPAALEPLAWLAGKWTTETGQGHFPTINQFTYLEELEFTCIGQPMLNYMAVSSHPEKKTPMHQERGFLRIKPGTNEVALIISHNMGLTSIEEGNINLENKEISLESTAITRISFAKQPHVKKIKRNIKLIGSDTLEIVIGMETEETSLTQHLKAVYKKKSE